MNFGSMLEKQFLEIMPFNIAVIDRDFKIIKANKNFEKLFGEWEDKYCYESYKKLDSPCSHCHARDVFATGEQSISDETGIDRYGRLCHYVVHLAPLKDESGKVQFIVEMSTDVTETNRLQREYNILFERAPCYITIIDSEFRVLRANEKFRATFGDERGKRCFELYKQKKTVCKYCPAALTFQDGKEHTFTQVGVSKTGEKTHYLVTTTPLSKSAGKVQLVIEIATDITELNKLEYQLKQTHDYYASVIFNSTDGIIALDKQGRAQIFNPAAKSILGWTRSTKPTNEKLRKMLPEAFFSAPDKDGIIIKGDEFSVKNESGDSVPVWLSAIEMRDKKEIIGKVAILQDLRQLKLLQRQMLDNERLSAVGETVAGLAHSIKNLLMSLEGGIYLTEAGLGNSDEKRIKTGWDMLKRNFDKTNRLVKDFLEFTGSKPLSIKLIDPNSLIENVVQAHKETAAQLGTEILLSLDPLVSAALFDPGALESCLTILLSNAIDATGGKKGNGRIIVKSEENGNVLFIKIIDNGSGIEPEMLQNIFTTYFTMKGNSGSGLGLLTAYRIAKEHGGSIAVESASGKGSEFTLSFPRANLDALFSLK